MSSDLKITLRKSVIGSPKKIKLYLVKTLNHPNLDNTNNQKTIQKSLKSA